MPESRKTLAADYADYADLNPCKDGFPENPLPRIGGILQHFRSSYMHDLHGASGTNKRRIEISKNFCRSGIVGAHDDPIRLHEVFDSGALLEELRVRNDIEWLRGFLLNDVSNLVRCPNRHRRFGDNGTISQRLGLKAGKWAALSGRRGCRLRSGQSRRGGLYRRDGTRLGLQNRLQCQTKPARDAGKLRA